jgi:cob(I)alamin adenosyltransferase
MIFILTGNGKGKTTSAIGMGIRAVGAGGKVLMIQFLKPGSSESKVIKKIKNFKIKSFGQRWFVLPKAELEKKPELKKTFGVRPIGKNDIQLAKEAFSLAERAARANIYNVIILDEICVVLKYKLLSQNRVFNFLKKYGNNIDIVLTGRYCPKEIIEAADLVSEIREIKHHYKKVKGQKAKKGIEY